MNQLEIEKEVVEKLIAINPKSALYMSDDIKSNYAHQIFLGLNENNLNNNESIQAGLKKSRLDWSGDMPSVGVFISDCMPTTAWADALNKVF